MGTPLVDRTSEKVEKKEWFIHERPMAYSLAFKQICSMENVSAIHRVTNSDYVTALEQRLKDVEKVIEFYGDVHTWISTENDPEGNLFAWEKRHPSHDVSIVPYSIGTSSGNFHCFGKKARAYMEKYNGK